MFEVGDKIVCTNIDQKTFVYIKRQDNGRIIYKKEFVTTPLKTISVGNTYNIINIISDKRITVTCDDGSNRMVASRRFVSLLKNRNIKIKKLKRKIHEI